MSTSLPLADRILPILPPQTNGTSSGTITPAVIYILIHSDIGTVLSLAGLKLHAFVRIVRFSLLFVTYI